MRAGRFRAPLIAAGTGMVCSSLTHTMVATTSPQIARDFAAVSSYGWINTTYFTTSVVCVVVAAPMTDRLGARAPYTLGMGIYTLGTLLAWGSPSMSVFLWGRICQGCGAGIVVPATLAIVGALPADDRGGAFGRLGMVQVLALAAGPLLGSYLATGPGWRVGFLATAALAALSMACAALLIPRTRSVPVPHPTRRLANFLPDLPLRLIRRILALSAIAGGLAAGVLTYVPWALATLWHLTPRGIAAALIPTVLAAAAGSLTGGALSRRRLGIRYAMATTLVGVAIIAVPALPALAVGAAIVSFGCAASFPILLAYAQAEAPRHQLATTSSWIQLGRHAGSAALVGGLGVATSYPAITAAAILISVSVLWALGGLLTSWRFR